MYSRRQFLPLLGVTVMANGQTAGGGAKAFRGVFPVMTTPFTASKAVDFEDLAREVDFLDHCGVHGMVWPQNASACKTLSSDERMRGMEVLARAIRGRKPALVLGVQAPNTSQMLEYARKAESLEPGALIAMPPWEAKSMDEYRAYYRALAGVTKRPVFIQTTGGAKGLTQTVEMVVEQAREFPHLGHVKEEAAPTIERLRAFLRERGIMKSVFGGSNGVSSLYEMRLGVDGTMPSVPYVDLLSQTWDFYRGGQQDKAREVFSKFLLLENLLQHIPYDGVTPYILKKRGVFKSTMTRLKDVQLTPEDIAEIDSAFEAVRSYLKA